MRPNNALKHERELRGWSQARVAEEIGTTALNVGRWERGSSLPYPHFREKLCQLFGKDARELRLLDDDSAADGVLVEARESANMAGERAIYDPAIPLPPAHNSRLVGRDALLARLRQVLRVGERSVLVALHGLPGAGKTALAIELAYDVEMRAHFRDGILWAGPGLQPDTTEILSRWGALLGVTTASSVRLESNEDWARAIRVAIGQRRMLLVVDDAWESAAALAFQVGGPFCAYLVTTRYPNIAVQLAAEGAFAVPELSEADGLALLERYAAAFVQQAPETALALVRSVGALPLALTLMGKYLSVQVYSGQPRRLTAAVEHLRDARKRLQLSEARALAERHPSLTNDIPLSLQSIIAVSDQLLDEYARSTLRGLSLFPAKPNSFAEEAALEVCQVSVETLDALCDAGLLESNGPSRYMLHQTIADYAREQLSDPAIAERMVSYYVTFVEKHEKEHELLKAETSNILAALEIAYTSHRREELARSVCALAEFLYVRGLYSLAEKHLLRAYEAARIVGDDLRVVRALMYLGLISRDWGKHDQAEAYLLEGLELARKRNYTEQVCDLLRNIGLVEDRRGNFAQAEACYREGLELARGLGQQEQVCRLLAGLGVQAGKRGNYAQAETYFQEGLALARQLDYSERVFAFLHNLGWIAYERGNYELAEPYYHDALEVADRGDYELSRAASRVMLGRSLVKRGELTQGQACLEEALQLLRRFGGISIWLQIGLQGLGELAIVEEDDERAEAYLQECLELSRRAGTREFLIEVCVELAKLEIRRNNYLGAEGYLREIQPLAYELGLNSLIAAVLLAWGEVNLRCGLPGSATQNFLGARAVASQEQGELQALALYGEARAALASCESAPARQLGEASLAIFSALGHYQAAEVENWLQQLPP
ncbi:MAG TPA: tetratricopeptide repeat protein [Ktedonobacteraceae bacterium]